MGLFQTFYEEELLASYSASSISWIFTTQLFLMYVPFLPSGSPTDIQTKVVWWSILWTDDRYIRHEICRYRVYDLLYLLRHDVESLERVLRHLPYARRGLWNICQRIIFVWHCVSGPVVQEEESPCSGYCAIGEQYW
jgi:hypothetical protein